MTHESTRISAEEMNALIYRELHNLPDGEGLTVRQLVERISRRLARDVTVAQVWNGITYMRQNSQVHMISEQRGVHSTHRITKNGKEVLDYARRRAADWGSDLIRIAAQVDQVRSPGVPGSEAMYDRLVAAIREAHKMMPKTRQERYETQARAMLDLNLAE